MGFQDRCQDQCLRLACVAALLLTLSQGLASAGTLMVTWSGGGADDNYSNTANWGPPVVPCGDFDVVFPDSSGTVNLDLDCDVVDFELGAATTFRTLGNSFNVTGTATIGGHIEAQGGAFSAPTASFAGSARAAAGANVFICSTEYDSTALNVNLTVLDATGAGSLLDLSCSTSLNLGFADASGGPHWHQVRAGDQATIDLSAATTVTIPQAANDFWEVDVSGSGSVDLSALATIPGAGGYTRFEARSASSIDLPGLTNVADLELLAHSGGQILINDPGQQVSYSTSQHLVNRRIFDASGAGSLLDLDAVTTLDFNFPDASGGPHWHQILATSEAMIDLSGISTLGIPLGGSDFVELEVSGMAQVDLAGLTTISGSGGYTFVQVSGGSTLSFPALTSAEDLELQATSGGRVLVNEPGQQVSYSTVQHLVNRRVLEATGADSLLDLSAFTSVDLGFPDASGGPHWHELRAGTNGVIDLSNVTSITVPQAANDSMQVILSGGGTLDLSNLPVISGEGGYTRVEASSGSSVALPALTAAEDLELSATTGAQISINAPGQQASYTTSGHLVNRRVLEATGEGSRLDLSGVVSLDFSFPDFSGGPHWHQLLASNGATIDLRNVTELTIPQGPADYLAIDVSGNGALDLTQLEQIPGAGGYTWMRVRSGSTMQLPSLTSAEDLELLADSGAQILINGPDQQVSYSTAQHLVNRRLLSAAGAGTLIDLSAINHFDLGFPDASGGPHWHEIFATTDAQIDLSGLTTLNIPQAANDFIEFDLSSGGTVDLSNLADIPGSGGYTRLWARTGSTVQLPGLVSAADLELEAASGGRILINAPGQQVSYSTTEHLVNRAVLSAQGAESLLDLTGVTSLDFGFADISGGPHWHQILTGTEGTIDLSNVTMINVPQGPSDFLDVRVASQSELSLGATVDVTGTGQFNVNGTTGGTFRTGDLASQTTALLRMATSDVTADINGTLNLRSTMALDVAATEVPWFLAGSLRYKHQDPDNVPLDESVLVMDGTAPQLLEVGGAEILDNRPAAANFGIGQLVVGSATDSTLVQLIDSEDNWPGPGAEALYLLGLDPGTAPSDGLVVNSGSTLSLGCINTYLFDDNTDTVGENLLDRVLPPNPAVVSFGDGFLQVDQDTDGDTVPDCLDNCPRTPNADQTDTNANGIGDTCEFILELDDPDVADELLGLGDGSSTGSALASAGDVNGDGLRDLLVGAPGFTSAGGAAAGAVALFLGSADRTERETPDVIFIGVDAHDRTGVAVAGDFDFNGAGPDILIGAEQVDRTGELPVPSGNGKAYLIYFDPQLYPNLDDPTTQDIVDLARVGNGQADEIPGVVFTGEALGDRLGFAVAGGGLADAGPGEDITLGAPGRDVNGQEDAGTAYVIFDDPALSGSVDVSRVANGLGDQVDGVVIIGAAPFDFLGAAVAFPGDVVGDTGDDVAIGMPGGDAPGALNAPDAGFALILQAGQLVVSVVEGCSIGDKKSPSFVAGVQIYGTQPGEALGSSIAGGGDNLANGERDLLVGAPLFDRIGETAADAGRVAQTAGKLPIGIFAVDSVGAPAGEPDALPGVIYIGQSAGDQLGTAVAGLDDVTGNGLADVAFGAPFADPDGIVDAGVVYVAAGQIPGDFFLGVIDLARGFPGTILIGEEAGEQAGAALAGTADMDGNETNDFAVGAPGRDGVGLTDSGLVYLVLQPPCNDQDPDNDGFGNCEDNCPLDFNADQIDTDGDGKGDACDNCVDAANAGQADTDLDRVGDTCDNCPDLSNASQADLDLDGVGDACDNNPRFRVSLDPVDNPDFGSLTKALAAARESGTRLEIFPIDGETFGQTCYDGIVVDRDMLFLFIGVDNGSAEPACIDGGAGPALDLLSTRNGFPHVIQNLTLLGAAGVRSDVATSIADVAFEDITDVALDLDGGSHRIRDVTLDASVTHGVDLESAASLTLQRARLLGLSGTAMWLDGVATVETALIAQTGQGIVVEASGSLELTHSTLADGLGSAVDASSGAPVTIDHTIAWAHAAAQLVGVSCTDVTYSNIGSPAGQDCTGLNDNVACDPLFDASYHASGACILDAGPDPATFDGSPCLDLDRGPRGRDYDGDGLALQDIGAYEEQNDTLNPIEVQELRWQDKQTLVWDPVPGATEYHVYSDATTTLSYASFGTCRDAIDPDRSDTMLVTDVPCSGQARYYLITATVGADEGSLGLGLCTERSNFSPCSEGSAEALTCP